MFAQKIVLIVKDCDYNLLFGIFLASKILFPRPIDDFRLPKGNLTLEPYTDKGLAKMFRIPDGEN